jgi:hypothetical protein
MTYVLANVVGGGVDWRELYNNGEEWIAVRDINTYNIK